MTTTRFGLSLVIGWVLVFAWPVITWGANDSVEVSVDVSAASQTGGGGGGGDDPEPNLGCTDPTATNYDSGADTDDGSCVYPPPLAVPNVSGLAASYDAVANEIVLTWQNPTDYPDFQAVRLMASQNGFPTDPNAGLLIYAGSDEFAVHSAPAAGVTVFYAIFVQSNGGDYSSGAVTSMTVPTPEIDEERESEESLPGDDDDESAGAGGTDDGGAGSSGGGDDGPFDIFPTVEPTDELVTLLDLGDFRFSQPGEATQFFASGDRLRLNGLKPFTVSIPYDLLPEALKIVGLTLFDPDDRSRSFSFLLRVDETKTAYTATIGPLAKSGDYPLEIVIVNYADQTIKRLSGWLRVSGAGAVAAAPVEELVRAAAAPVVISSGVIAGLIQTAAWSGNVTSVYDFYLVFVKLLGLIGGALGLRRKRAPWGVVYDSVTKRPLDPAYVVIKSVTNPEEKTAITDLDGRYGFLVSAGQYQMVANKTHYRFPSTKLAGRSEDELYAGLYHGETFATIPGEVVNRNIPLDPESFDWNEYAKDKQGFFQLHTRREKTRARILNSLHLLGFALAAYNGLTNPGWLNLTILGFYVVLSAGGWWWRGRHQARLIRRESTGLPLAFAVVKVFLPGVDQLIKTVVADQLGRFFLLTPPGEYYVTVEEKQDDESYREVYRSAPQVLKRGIIEQDIVLP